MQRLRYASHNQFGVGKEENDNTGASRFSSILLVWRTHNMPDTQGYVDVRRPMGHGKGMSRWSME